MSIQKIIENIEKNVEGRIGAAEVLEALELATRMPVTFLRMVQAGKFFATHHDYHDPPHEEGCCDDCYSGDTEFEQKCVLTNTSVALFQNMTVPTDNSDSEDAEDTEDSEDNERLPTEKVEQLPKYPPMGFKTPVLLTPALVGFLREADCGLSDPTDPNSESLNESLLTTAGLSTRAILTPLINIYAFKAQMQKDPKNLSMLTATPLMYKWFGDTFAEIQAIPEKKSPFNGTHIPAFDPEHFRYASIQSIIALNIVPRDTLTEEQMNEMYQPEVLKALDQDQAMVSNCLKFLRDQKMQQKIHQKGLPVHR